MSARPRSVRSASACVVLACVVASFAPSAVIAAPCWRPPVDAPVSDPYRAPACPWCPGNRGIEFDTTSGEVVTSVVAGRVSYAGAIAGVRYVVVEIANGWRITYGDVATTDLGRGDVVVAGAVIGSARESFHFGLRDGDEYIDPTPYLGEWTYSVRLIPADGGTARPSPPPTVQCGRLAPAHRVEGPTRDSVRPR